MCGTARLALLACHAVSACTVRSHLLPHAAAAAAHRCSPPEPTALPHAASFLPPSSALAPAPLARSDSIEREIPGGRPSAPSPAHRCAQATQAPPASRCCRPWLVARCCSRLAAPPAPSRIQRLGPACMLCSGGPSPPPCTYPAALLFSIAELHFHSATQSLCFFLLPLTRAGTRRPPPSPRSSHAQ